MPFRILIPWSCSFYWYRWCPLHGMQQRFPVCANNCIYKVFLIIIENWIRLQRDWGIFELRLILMMPIVLAWTVTVWHCEEKDCTKLADTPMLDATWHQPLKPFLLTRELFSDPEKNIFREMLKFLGCGFGFLVGFVWYTHHHHPPVQYFRASSCKCFIFLPWAI